MGQRQWAKEEAVHGYKRPEGGILVVLELFCILTLVVDTQAYTGDKIS